MSWKLKISDLLIAFVWLSFLLGTCSQLINSAAPAVFNCFAALCYCSIILLRIKLRLATESISFLITGSLNLITSIAFFSIGNYSIANWSTGLFVFISVLSIGISLVLLAARLTGGFNNDRPLNTMNRILELLAPSSCGALFFACFGAHVFSSWLTIDLFPLFIGGLIFLLTIVLVVASFQIEKSIKK